MGRGYPTKIFGKSDVFDLKRSEKKFGWGAPLVDYFLPIFAEIPQFSEIPKDLFFNYFKIKIYLSKYRRIGGFAALENVFEKCTS